MSAGTLKKRERLDIYADILEVLKHRPEGVLITRVSYGAGLPIDRVKPMLDGLTHCELVSVRVKGDPLQSSLVQRRFYHVTKKGLEFLDAYRKIQDLLIYLKEASISGKKPSAPMDYVSATE
jgi:predicted transcriptional regulator